MFGLKEMLGLEKKTEDKKEEGLTKSEESLIKEGEDARNEMENSMNAEKIAEEIQETDVDKRTDFSKAEEGKE